MPGSGVQAFLTTSEQWVLVRRVVRLVPCHILISRGIWPEWHLQRYELGAEPLPNQQWRMHFLLHEPVDSPIGTNPNLGEADWAGGPLSINNGSLEGGVLEETSCSFKTEVSAALAAWKPILAWLRRSTMCGAIAKRSADDAGTFYKDVRCSSGAMTAFESGVMLKQMRQAPFWFEPRPSKRISFPSE